MDNTRACVQGWGRALTSPARIEILELIADAPRPMSFLAHELGISVGDTSEHLRILREAGLVVTRQTGREVRFELADPIVAGRLRELRARAERRLTIVQQILEEAFSAGGVLEGEALAELRVRVHAELVGVIDPGN
jgi:DNA-binding transcriptional ArsR family regulator